MKKHLIVILLFSAFLCSIISCKNGRSRKVVIRDTSINTSTSYNNLFLDSTLIARFLDSNSSFREYENQLYDWYTARNYQYAWFDSSSINPQANQFINLLQSTVENLKDSSLYDKQFISVQHDILNNSIPLRQITNTELMLTAQFFKYAITMYKGSDVDATALGWYIPRKKVDVGNMLLQSLATANSNNNSFALLHPQFNALQSALKKYHELSKLHWEPLPYPPKSIRVKDSSMLLPKIKERLFLLGDADKQNNKAVYDSSFISAVQSFQKRMGLEADGIIGKKMLDALNITPLKRIEQILINLERMRWLPLQQDSNYIVVNIPEYALHVFENGTKQFDMKVIVGTATNSTVIFTGNLKYIVFSPYWNVPFSITSKELMPAIKRNSNYLHQKNMEITGYENGTPVIRQKPGSGNALGNIKFLFPNSHSIYLHDTPNKTLFNENTRSFSHGCIRLAEPKKLAQYLLRADTAGIWKSSVIDSCMQLTKEKWVTLQQSVPVYIVYFTAWVDENGRLNFRNDIYKHDEKMAAKMFVR